MLQSIIFLCSVSCRSWYGYIIDKESERERDRQDVRDGLMQPWEYRLKWYGETEADAKAILEERENDDDMMGFGGLE